MSGLEKINRENNHYGTSFCTHIVWGPLSCLFFLSTLFSLIELNHGSPKIHATYISLFKSFLTTYSIITHASLLKYCDKRKTEMCIVKFELNSIVVNSKQQTSLGLY